MPVVTALDADEIDGGGSTCRRMYVWGQPSLTPAPSSLEDGSGADKGGIG